MIDDQFDEQLRDAVRDYHRPPETPRDAIWARIEAARQEQQAPVVPIRRLPRRLAWGVGIAATLAIGVAIGRYSVARTPVSEPQVASGTTAPVESATRPTAVTNSTREPAGTPAAPSLAYRMATIEHFTRTEALLTTLRADAQSGRADPSVDAWARDLLGTTRMLLDSPAARDPQMAALLNDLELVLAQIAALPRTHERTTDIDLINDAVRQHAVLTRLRMAIPAGSIRVGT
ncbi:MAG TPA: hypothetical protein VFJ96_14450 [Gemmatimonadaceae bacterium]|nr:hypothetical protein [Gemmatimonadaceae bacterium]